MPRPMPSRSSSRTPSGRSVSAGGPSRRELLQGVSLLLGGALSPSVQAAVLNSGLAGQTSERLLSEQQLDLIGAVAERVLPRTGTPGALDAGVPAYIDEMVSNYFKSTEREDFLQGLEGLEALAQNRYGSTFVQSTEEQQDSLIGELDGRAFGKPNGDDENSATAAYRSLKELSVIGFYTSEAGQTQELRPLRYGSFRSDFAISADTKAWS